MCKIDIDPSGVLDVHFLSGALIISGDENDFEEIWSIASNTPDPHGDTDWAITFTEERELVVRRPSIG